MGIEIVDGTGSGFKAKVDGDKRHTIKYINYVISLLPDLPKG